jgi:hypothetical protein
MLREELNSRPARRSPRLAVALLASAVLLVACSAVPPPPPVAPPPPAPVPVPPPPPPPPPPPEVDPADAAARRLLAFHDHVRLLAAPELGQEVSRLNGLVTSSATAAPPGTVLELALALSLTRNNGDLGRSVALLDPIVRSTAPELKPWQPLARLLMTRFIEQRRVEEQVERQAQQLRDSQRNVQQLNEKLEALKAIERSLNARPALPPGAPAASSPPKP